MRTLCHAAPVENLRPAVVLVPASADTAGLVDAGTPDGQASLARGGAVVAAAVVFVNVAGYALTVVAARALDRSDYGALSALLNVLLVLTVPALAVQAVVARAIASRPSGEARGPRERALLLRATALGVPVALVGLAAVPAQDAFLRTGSAGPLWTTAQLLPAVVLAAAMGVLQGQERFGALSLVIVVQGLSKLVAVVPLAAGRGGVAVLAALAAGVAVTLALALVLVGRGRRGPAPPDLPTSRDAVRAATGLAAVLVLANLDLLLARHVLSGDESGRYGVGSVFAKGAFWLPQAVAVVVFPRLVHPEAGTVLLRRAVAVVGGLGLLEALGTLLLAHPILVLAFGARYGSLSALAPLWVVQGAVLAVVQLVVYRGIATGDPLPGRLAAVAVGVEAVLVLAVRPQRPSGVLVLAAGTAVVLLCLLLPRAVRR